MKQALFTSLLSLFLVTPSYAAFVPGDNNSSNTAPNIAEINTVAKALAAPDDSFCVLKGNVIEMIGKKHYKFRDSTGTIKVKIKPEIFRNQTITPNNLVLIHGEVDKDDFEPVKIDVKYIRSIK